eukprot:TRINITY_DN917_c2_g2_i1.p1 TRINITY_DN917_c2_g2~~TRINITY_DN917_c2_g2_i1.p1  ORF type:complete len:407 (-),score=132.32 TRINITY_DN917_c2_g2_i1:214-1434(-)
MSTNNNNLNQELQVMKNELEESKKREFQLESLLVQTKLNFTSLLESKPEQLNLMNLITKLQNEVEILKLEKKQALEREAALLKKNTQLSLDLELIKDSNSKCSDIIISQENEIKLLKQSLSSFKYQKDEIDQMAEKYQKIFKENNCLNAEIHRVTQILINQTKENQKLIGHNLQLNSLLSKFDLKLDNESEVSSESLEQFDNSNNNNAFNLEDIKISLQNHDFESSCKDFFNMIIIAVKLNMISENPEIFEEISVISNQELLIKAKQQNIAFHQYYDWVRKFFQVNLNDSNEENNGKDQEIKVLETQLIRANELIETQKKEIIESTNLLELLELQDNVLKKELRNLEKARIREKELNFQYLKNILLQFFKTQDILEKKQLMRVIYKLLEFNNEEIENIQKLENKLK